MLKTIQYKNFLSSTLLYNGYYDFAIKDQLNLNVRPVRDIAYRGK
jgi:hypothetical protein